MSKCSLNPSVTQCCDIPDAAEQSFVHVTISALLNNSVFSLQPLQAVPQRAKVLKFTDRGSDDKNTTEL